MESMSSNGFASDDAAGKNLAIEASIKSRMLAGTLIDLCVIFDCQQTNPQDAHHVDCLQSVLNRFSKDLDGLEILLGQKNQLSVLKKMYPADGVEFDGVRYGCYSEAIMSVAKDFWFLLSLVTRPNEALNEIGKSIPYSVSRPVLNAKNAAIQSRHLRESFPIQRPELERLKIFLQTEHFDIIETAHESNQTVTATSNIAIPVEILKGWVEILEVLKRPDTDKDWVNRLNKQTEGPIQIQRGAQPKVDKAELVKWWNHQNDRAAASMASLDARAASRDGLTQVPYRNIQVVPEIGGSVKKRAN